MKKAIILAAVLLACAKKDEPAPDTAAAAVGPPALTASEITGTWNGVAMAETSDSVLYRFVGVMSPDGMSGKAIVEGTKDSVQVTHVYDADSVVATSAPYTDQMLPGKPQVMFRAVARMVGGKLVGRGAVMLASKHDSVLARNRFEMTKAP